MVRKSITFHVFSQILSRIYRGITHDPELYPDPHTFKPERHMGSHPETDPYKFVWGFGRRACPGEQFAAIKVYHSNSYLSLTSQALI